MKRLYFVMMLLVFHLSSIAQLGSIAVYPTRIHLDDQKRTEEVEFINLSEDTLTFTISFSHYRMAESGALVLLEEPDTSLLIVDNYLRIFPRMVTIGPREKQKVRLQYRRNSSMKSGEYRSHLTFSQFVDETELAEKYGDKKDTVQLQTFLMQLFRICVPAFIQTGEVKVETAVENIHLYRQDTLQNLSFDINRIGNGSLYGDVEVEYQPLKGKPYLVGKQKFVSIYSEVEKRIFQLALQINEEELSEGGELTIRYMSNKSDGMERQVFCEKQFQIN